MYVKLYIYVNSFYMSYIYILNDIFNTRVTIMWKSRSIGSWKTLITEMRKFPREIFPIIESEIRNQWKKTIYLDLYITVYYVGVRGSGWVSQSVFSRVVSSIFLWSSSWSGGEWSKKLKLMMADDKNQWQHKDLTDDTTKAVRPCIE